MDKPDWAYKAAKKLVETARYMQAQQTKYPDEQEIEGFAQIITEAWNTRTHVSVPVDPTEEMIDAGEEQHWTGRFPLRERIANIYKAMIAAYKEGKIDD